MGREPLSKESQLLDALGEALVAVDADMRITLWNRSAERLFGWTADETVGQFLPGLIANNVIYESAFAVVRTVRSGQVWRGPLKLRHKSGIEVALQSTASAIYDEIGTCTGYVS